MQVWETRAHNGVRVRALCTPEWRVHYDSGGKRGLTSRCFRGVWQDPSLTQRLTRDASAVHEASRGFTCLVLILIADWLLLLLLLTRRRYAARDALVRVPVPALPSLLSPLSFSTGIFAI